MNLLKRYLILIAVAFVLVVLLSLVKNEFARHLPGYDTGLPAVERESASNQLDALFMGSSTFKRGLDMTQFDQAGRNGAFLVAYNGNQPFTMQMALSELWSHGVRPKRLYVDFYPYLVAANPKLSDARLLVETDTAFKWSLWRRLCEADACDATTFHETFVTSNNVLILFWPLYRWMNREKTYRGASRVPMPGSTTDQLNTKPLFGQRDGLQSIQLTALQRLTEEAKSLGIEVYFVETPKYTRLQNDHTYQTYLQAMIDAALTYLPRENLILASDLTFDQSEPTYFNDLVHLSTTGAKAFTTELIRAIERVDKKSKK